MDTVRQLLNFFPSDLFRVAFQQLPLQSLPAGIRDSISPIIGRLIVEGGFVHDDERLRAQQKVDNFLLIS